VWDGVLKVLGTVTVPAGRTLTINPGTILKFVTGGLNIQGVLNVPGTVDEPVIFTSWKDDSAGGDTNDDGCASTPAAGDWAGLTFLTHDLPSTLDGIVLRYAATGVSVGTYNGPTSGFVKLNGAVVDHNNLAIEAGSAYSRLEAQNTLVVGNAQGLLAVGTAGVTLRNCTIAGNGAAGTIGNAVLAIQNTIFAFNTTGLTGWPQAGDVTARNSLFSALDAVASWIGQDAFQRGGNIIADPLFVDRAASNFELAAHSPAIDAGRGIDAPAADILGRPRFDDLSLENAGSGSPSYVDIGVFERQPSTAPAANLAVVGVSATPLDLAAGESLAVNWTVENVGQQDLSQSWFDAVYLSSDPYLSTADDRLLGEVAHSGSLTSGSRYSATWSGTIPIGVAGPQYVIVQTNSRRAFREVSSSDNVTTFDQVLAVALPTLTTATAQSGHVNPGQWTYYRFDAQPGRTIRFALDSAVSSGAVQLYLRRGAIPTASNYDVAATAFNQPDQELRLLEPSAGVYYMGVYGQSLAAGGTNFTLSAEPTNLNVRQITTNRVGNAGRATVKIEGDNFDRTAQAQLVASDGRVIEAMEWFQDASTLFATFDLAGVGAAAGFYDVVITNPSLASVTAYDLLTVVAGGTADFKTDLVVPGAARPNREIQVQVQYRNTGSIDLLSPLLTIESADGVAWRFPGTEDDAWINGSTISFLALSGDSPAAILRPGKSATLTLTARTPFTPGEMPFTLYSFGTPGDAGLSQAIDWNQLGNDLRPPDSSADAWTPLFERLKAQVGSTWGDYLVVLRDNANHLAEINQRVYDSTELFSFEFVQALTMGTPTYLDAAQDAFCPAPGLSLSFDRCFPPDPSHRALLGALGRGWTHSYDITLQKRSDGAVVVNGSSGFDRIFESDGSGGSKAGTGDRGTLTALPDGEFLLTEQSGLKVRFRADGLFADIKDTNGNALYASYNAQGRLVSVIHSSSDRIRFEYNTAGRLVKVIDPAGRATVYAYDPSGEHLVSVTTPDGQVTSYAYITGAGVLTNHLMTSIIRPGGLQVSFSYDSLGRLSEQHVATDEESVRYTYTTAGKTFITEALGNTSTIWLDSLGRTAMMQDPLGNRSRMYYDTASNLTKVTGPTGLISQFTYDATGNLVASRDPMGYETSFGYGGAFDDLQWVRDARGNATHYAYDERGNLAAITYADGTSETYQYDGAGDLIASTNRRGQTITYTYNTRGQLISKDYPDTPGVVDFIYVYDGAGNLASAKGPEGTTSLAYEASTDRLLRIDYPGGKFFLFEYDAAGRRTKRTDQSGNVVNYLYDCAGRLDRMTDGPGAAIVDYDYDVAGRMTRKSLGNGVYTTYEYDAAGQLLHLVNWKPDGTALSRFDYTYNAMGRQTAMDSLDGLWTYSYDDDGQLIRAVLDSENPGITDQDQTYVYDPVGNRIRTVTNSAVTEYTTNNMNQYTRVGTAAYNYDADGNMFSVINGGATTAYTYNVDNRLIGVTTPTGVWAYTYNVLGNRVATTENGSTTRYVIDPAGLGDVAAEYNSSGNLIARYDHGYGLLSRTNFAGASAWYTFSAIGNTSELTGDSVAMLNSYAYDPFGVVLAKSEAVVNPFRFTGEYGVMHEPNGLDFMRARFYDGINARFLSADPVRLASGDINLYRYVGNVPTGAVDPLGLARIGWGGPHPQFFFNKPTKITLNGKTEEYTNIGFGHTGDLRTVGMLTSEDLETISKAPIGTGGDTTAGRRPVE